MSWFTELAGKAEEFLNKVDKGAASALGSEILANPNAEPKQHSSGRTGSTSSEPFMQPSPSQIPRKGSTPDLGAYAARSKPSVGGSGSSGSSPRGLRSSGHKKSLSNTGTDAAADHTDEDLLEFLNAPTEKKPSSSVEAMASSLSGTPEPPVGDEAEARIEAEQNGVEYSETPIEPQYENNVDQLDAAGENTLLRNEVQSLNREISQMFKKLKSNDKEVVKLRQDLERERENLRRVNSRLREMQDRENDMSQLIEAKDSQVSVLKVRLNEAEEKLRMIDSELDATKVENERILQASTESSSFHSNTVETLRKQVEDLEDALTKEREATRMRNQDHMRKISELEEAQASLAASFAEAEHRAEVQAQMAEKRRQDLAVGESRIEQAQRELSDYKQKAQRILQSKEKLIATLKSGRKGGDSSGGGDASDSMEMEQLRQERDLLREETGKQQAALDLLKVQINDLEVGHHNALAAAQDQLRYQNELLEEERNRTRELQVQCSQINDELVFLREDLTQQKFNFAAKMQDRDVEIEKLRKQLMAKKMSSVSQAEVETRLQALTQNLLQKQTLIEQLTTEKSALTHQIERMERNRRDVVTYRPGANGQDTYLTINSTDDGTEQSLVDMAKAHIPSFMVESPLDSRMARRVKRAYSTLDTFSIRLGVFLRRFPIARIMVLGYMGLLHLWVMIVLLTYQPEIHDADYDFSQPHDRSAPRL